MLAMSIQLPPIRSILTVDAILGDATIVTTPSSIKTTGQNANKISTSSESSSTVNQTLAEDSIARSTAPRHGQHVQGYLSIFSNEVIIMMADQFRVPDFVRFRRTCRVINEMLSVLNSKPYKNIQGYGLPSTAHVSKFGSFIKSLEINLAKPSHRIAIDNGAWASKLVNLNHLNICYLPTGNKKINSAVVSVLEGFILRLPDTKDFRLSLNNIGARETVFPKATAVHLSASPRFPRPFRHLDHLTRLTLCNLSQEHVSVMYNMKGVTHLTIWRYRHVEPFGKTDSFKMANVVVVKFVDCGVEPNFYSNFLSLVSFPKAQDVCIMLQQPDLDMSNDGRRQNQELQIEGENRDIWAEVTLTLKRYNVPPQLTVERAKIVA
ncbi:hypothetical protein HDU97_006835 [Phlyctochytrium planicorne]|nr:hypothetical protein HDU97_006835 [Phlyctochytrium planicorne]